MFKSQASIKNPYIEGSEGDVLEGLEIQGGDVVEGFMIYGPTKKVYKELKPVGILNPDYNKTVYLDTVSLDLKKSKLWEIDPDFCEENDHLVRGKFFYNIPTRRAVEKAEDKLDEERPWPIYDDSKYYALAAVDKMLELPLTHKMWTHEQVMHHTELTKGVGMPLRCYGYTDRASFYESDEFRNALADEKNGALNNLLIGYGVFTRNVAKVEFATIQDYMEDKARTFNIPGANVLYAQHRCYAQGNENLKMYMWSYYGFNPFSGGVKTLVDRIFERKENGKFKYPIRYSWDARGYDRKVDLRHVSRRRYRYFCNANSNEVERCLAKWVSNGLEVSMMIMTNGDIVLRVRGNNSGSGLTTSNNIEAGFEISADVLCAAYYFKKNRLPSYEKLIEQIIALFGDDNVGALANSFSKILDIVWLKDRLLRFHGMILKEFVGGYEYPLEKLQFLGFSFYQWRDTWLPRWSIARMSLPLLYTERKYEPAIFMQRMFSILTLMWPYHDNFERLKIAYLRCLQHFMDPKHVGAGHPMIKAFISNSVPDSLMMERFYTGMEGGGPIYYYMARITNKQEDSLLRERILLQRNQEALKILNAFEGNDLVFVILHLEEVKKTLNEMCNKQNNSKIEEVSSKADEADSTDDLDQLREASKDLKTLKAYKPRYRKIDVSTDKIAEESNGNKPRTNKTVKPGSYNAYGNQQMALVQFTITQPGFTYNNPVWTCVSTCLMPNPVHIVGTGSTEVDAWEDWMTKCMAHFEDWAPVETNVFLTELRKLSPPSKDSPIFELWTDPNPTRLLKKFMEGSFNPYGNGQPRICEVNCFQYLKKFLEGGFNPYGNGQPLLTYAQYKAINAKAFSKLSEQQISKKYAAYKRRNGGVVVPKIKNVPQKGYKQKFEPKAMIARERAVSKLASVNPISECARVYAVALRCPFYFQDEICPKVMNLKGVTPKTPVCYPGPYRLNTRKMCCWVKGTFGIQTTTNHGFILFAPARLANNNGIANNRDCPVLTSLSNPVAPLPLGFFAGVDTGAAGWGNVGAAYNFNSDYSTAQLILTAQNQGIKYRVVAAGLRVKYIGPKLTEAGLIHFIEDPDHATLSNQSVASISGFEGYFNHLVDKESGEREWHELTFTPVQELDFQFEGDSIANATFTARDNHFMGMIISGCPTGDNFQYEAVTYFEAIGNQVRGKTVTPTDPTGASAALNMIGTDTQGQNDLKNIPIASTLASGAKQVSGLTNTISDTVKLGTEIMEGMAPFAKMFL